VTLSTANQQHKREIREIVPEEHEGVATTSENVTTWSAAISNVNATPTVQFGQRRLRVRRSMPSEDFLRLQPPSAPAQSGSASSMTPQTRSVTGKRSRAAREAWPYVFPEDQALFPMSVFERPGSHQDEFGNETGDDDDDLLSSPYKFPSWLVTSADRAVLSPSRPVKQSPVKRRARTPSRSSFAQTVSTIDAEKQMHRQPLQPIIESEQQRKDANTVGQPLASVSAAPAPSSTGHKRSISSIGAAVDVCSIIAGTWHPTEAALCVARIISGCREPKALEANIAAAPPSKRVKFRA